MRSFIKTTVLLYVIVFILLPSAYGNITLYDFGKNTGEVSISGESMARYEMWNWFEPVTLGRDNEYSYAFNRARLGIKYDNPYFTLFAQGQYTQFFDLPNNATAPAPEGPLGLGPLYFNHSRDRFSNRVFLKQGYLYLKDLVLSDDNNKVFATIGRFDYKDGLESLSGDKKIDTLKKMRLSEKMIGPFGWSAYTRSYDGFTWGVDNEKINFTSMLSRPTQGGFEETAGATIDTIDLITATLTVKKDAIIPGMEERLFYYYYNDYRGVTQRIDNTGFGANKVDIQINTYGGHIVGAYGLGPGQADILFWGALQNGNWYGLDHYAGAFAAEGGYQFKEAPWKPWIRTGFLYSTGDNDSADNDHTTFYQMLPTARKYALSPIYNLMNNEDFFVQLLLTPIDNLKCRIDWHKIYLTEKADRFYAGAGPTQKKGSIFGYVGRNSGNKDGLGELLDISLNYDLNKYFSISFYYGHFFGGDLIKNIYSNEDMDFGYVETTVKF